MRSRGSGSRGGRRDREGSGEGCGSLAPAAGASGTTAPGTGTVSPPSRCRRRRRERREPRHRRSAARPDTRYPGLVNKGPEPSARRTLPRGVPVPARCQPRTGRDPRRLRGAAVRGGCGGRSPKHAPQSPTPRCSAAAASSCSCAAAGTRRLHNACAPKRRCRAPAPHRAPPAPPARPETLSPRLPGRRVSQAAGTQPPAPSSSLSPSPSSLLLLFCFNPGDAFRGSAAPGFLRAPSRGTKCRPAAAAIPPHRHTGVSHCHTGTCHRHTRVPHCHTGMCHRHAGVSQQHTGVSHRHTGSGLAVRAGSPYRDIPGDEGEGMLCPRCSAMRGCSFPVHREGSAGSRRGAEPSRAGHTAEHRGRLGAREGVRVRHRGCGTYRGRSGS